MVDAPGKEKEKRSVNCRLKPRNQKVEIRNGSWVHSSRSLFHSLVRARSRRRGQWKRLRDGWILGPSLSSSTDIFSNYMVFSFEGLAEYN